MIPVISSGLAEAYGMAEVMALDILCLLHIFHQNPTYLIPHVKGKNSQCDVHFHIVGGIQHSDLPLCHLEVAVDHRFLMLLRTMSLFELHGKQKKTHSILNTMPHQYTQ